MSRDFTVLLTCVALIGGVQSLSAQSARAPDPSDAQVSIGEGYLRGVVTDEGGHSIGGVSILAMGTSLAAVTTDSAGHFSLSLPIGQYVLRAAREGYISTYREPIRVQTNVTLERRIRLLRVDGDGATAAGATAIIDPASPAVPDEQEHGHSDIAWRLRHLTRTVLRDESPGLDWQDETRVLDGRVNFLDGVVRHSARAAVDFFSNADFSGQVNVFTTQSVDASGRLPGGSSGWPTGAADVIVGARAGSYGDWSARGVMASSDAASWMVLGEFRSRADQRHVVRFGVSYSTQTLGNPREGSLAVDVPLSRSVGGIYGSDRWQLTNRVGLEYGARFNRYDYLTTPDLLSPRAAVRWRVAGRTSVTASLQQRMTAPGAEQFLPPTSSGLWLPPERTFSPLAPDTSFRPERITQQTVGVEHEFRAVRPIVVRIVWFSQDTADQMATVFGLDRASTIGHYYIARVGAVDVQGWKARVGGQLTSHVRGAVEYVSARADWRPSPMPANVRRLAPTALRRGDERIDDVVGSLDVALPETGTDVSVAYRLSNGFSISDRATRAPVAGGRVKLEVRQHLPYQPLRTGTLNLLFALQTLLHDQEELGSFYDELLTVKPPLRLTGGVQVQF